MNLYVNPGSVGAGFAKWQRVGCARTIFKDQQGDTWLKEKVDVRYLGSSSGPDLKQVVRGRTRGMRICGATSKPHMFWHCAFQTHPY